MTFDNLLVWCNKTAYPEPRTPLHDYIMPKAIESFCSQLQQGAIVLDVGFGACYSLELFKEKGMNPVGYTLLQAEADEAKAKGFEAIRGDMHDQIQGKYDGVFLRHVIEHSPCPALVLHNVFEAMKEGGYLYVEVPLPDTLARHETNANHWTMLTQSCWQQLLSRVGFVVKGSANIRFQLPLGPDCYWSVLCQKPFII